MKYAHKLLPLAAALALLSACGGGGDNGPTAGAERAVDKYLGTWKSNCQLEFAVGSNPFYPNGLSETDEVTLVAVSANAFKVAAATEKTYPSADCTGTPATNNNPGDSTFTVVGQATIGTEAADKIRTTSPTKAEDLGLILLKDGKLYFDDDTSPADDQGYPTAFDWTIWFEKS